MLNLLYNGIIPNCPDQYALFESIEDKILKRMKNDMSLICRVGRTIFTGDANKVQLNEVYCRNRFFTMRITLHGELTIKINHHGSPTNTYKNLDFYSNLSPVQLLLKGDDRVKNASGFNQYKNQLNGCVCSSRFIDSENNENILGIPFTT